MEIITENEYAHWLYCVPGIGSRSIEKLLNTGMTCKEIYETNIREFKGLVPEKKLKALDESRRIWNFEKEKEKLQKSGIRFVSRLSDEFPEKLKNIPDSPLALFVKGNLPDPEAPSVAIIGARMCSEYGRYEARQFGRGLALAGVQVISGMAKGVDGISQKAALSVGGKSYGILGSGVDFCYPEENRDVYNKLCENGGVISEYLPGTEPRASLFPMRNRIISGLADVILVIEAREKSGTQITVDTALEQGREVIAVPGRITDRLSDGCNLLISQGAGAALDVEDVLERIRDIRNGQSPHIVTGLCKRDGTDKADTDLRLETENELEDMMENELSLEDRIVSVLDIIPVSASSIMEELYRRGIDISIQQLMSSLMELTYKGRIAQNGAYYRKIG